MRQRVAFLRTLLAGTPVLCLDEPFGALDALTRVQMQEWLAAALAREPRTVLLVTHDVEEAIVLADRVVLLSPRPGPRGRDARRRTCRGRAAAAITPSPTSTARALRALGVGLPCAVRLVLVLLGGWEAVVRGGLVDPLILPAPTAIAEALVRRPRRCSAPTCG